jgi:hypothetical protein
MINTAGIYILVLILGSPMGGGAGITTHEMANFESCQAATTQLEPVRYLTGYCIAKDIIKND